jgi:hypothetical protein
MLFVNHYNRKGHVLFVPAQSELLVVSVNWVHTV